MDTLILPEKSKDRKRSHRLLRGGIRRSRKERKVTKKKYSSWDEPLREKLEQELNDYGMKFGVRTYIEHLKNWNNEWFEIKATIGVFDEYAVYTCSYSQMKSELESMIRASCRYPQELEKIQVEMAYLMEGYTD